MSYTKGDTVRVISGENVLVGTVDVYYPNNNTFDLLVNGNYFYIDPDDWIITKKVILPTKQRALIYVGGGHYILLGDYWYHATEGEPISPDLMQQKAEKSTNYRVIFGGEE